jgi:rhodanese-related sulfurtransferase
MKPGFAGETPDSSRSGWQRVLLEAACVLMMGGMLALVANALSPRGLSLTRDYFPVVASNPTAIQTPSNRVVGTATTGAITSTSVSVTNPTLATNTVIARLQAHGLQPISHDEVVAMFRDPRAAQDQFIFVDARNDKQYQEGHIPGALQLDYYHPEQYLPLVLTACQIAEKIVIYCSGGECEDSELTASLLAKVLPKEKLFVYPGGFTQWSSGGQPVELGARRSGVLKEDKR